MTSEIIKDIKIKKLEKNQIIFGKVKTTEGIEKIEKIFKKILKEKIKFEFFIGWGEGKTIEEARYYCEESYKKNKLSNNQIFFLTNNKYFLPISDTSKQKNNNLKILEKFTSLNISIDISKNIINFFKKENYVSANNLSQYLNISERTSNRILKKL